MTPVTTYLRQLLRAFALYTTFFSAGNSDRNVSVRLSVRLSRAGIVSKRRKHDFFSVWYPKTLVF